MDRWPSPCFGQPAERERAAGGTPQDRYHVPNQAPAPRWPDEDAEGPVFLVAPDLVLVLERAAGAGAPPPLAEALAPGRPPRPPNQVGPNQQGQDG